MIKTIKAMIDGCWINGELELFDISVFENNPIHLKGICLSNLEWANESMATFLLFGDLPGSGYLSRIQSQDKINLAIIRRECGPYGEWNSQTQVEVIAYLENCKVIKKRLGDDLVTSYPNNQEGIKIYAFMEARLRLVDKCFIGHLSTGLQSNE